MGILIPVLRHAKIEIKQFTDINHKTNTSSGPVAEGDEAPMEHYRTEYREELLTDTGEVRASKGDKVLFYAGPPENTQNNDRSFPVWVKAIVQKSGGDQVWLEKVDVLTGFKNKTKNDLVL